MLSGTQGHKLKRHSIPAMRHYFVYILASQRNGTLYTGVTGALSKRVWEHREDLFGGFTKKYGVKMLVYYEVHDDPQSAITREKQIKRWRREWKKNLIEKSNPHWTDLYDNLMNELPFA